MRVLILSTKPNYVKEIINGNKRYEFRKTLFNNHGNVAKVFIYFNGYNEGFAIEIKSLHIFEVFIDPEELIPNFVPPQSFRYIDDFMKGGV